MSMLSKYVDRYMAKKVAKHGIKGTIIWLIGKLVKLTPTKKDDQMFREIQQVMKKFD